MPESLDDWRAAIQQADDLGFFQILMGDHLGEPRFASIPAMAVASAFNDRLRFGTVVFNNDLRHPVILAKDVATLDVVTEGRYQFGIGAGWMTKDYEGTGIKKDDGRIRVERLGESIQIIKALWGEGPVTFVGRHYRIKDLEGWPKPIQKPHPPIFMGGGARLMLSLAAQHADIVGLQPVHRGGVRGGGEELSVRALERRYRLVREQADHRFSEILLHMLIHAVAVTNQPGVAAERLGKRFGLDADQALESPYLLIGPPNKIFEDVNRLRDRYEISYFSVRAADAPGFAPVMRELVGA